MANKASKPVQKVVYRNSKNGQFVPEKYAQKHKDTTEKEKVP